MQTKKKRRTSSDNNRSEWEVNYGENGPNSRRGNLEVPFRRVFSLLLVGFNNGLEP